MRTFYRVETLNMDEDGQSVGGYMAAVDTMLCLKLGLKPDYTEEELSEATSKSTDPCVKDILVCVAMLGDIPIPEIYKEDSDNMYCLYSKEEFDEAKSELRRLWQIMLEIIPAYTFRYKKFKLNDDEIAYKDAYQAVITKEVYEKHKNDSKYQML